MIIFDNKQYYDKLIKNGFEKFPNKRDLTILAKEWYNNQNVPKDKIADKLVQFCKECNSKFNTSKFENTIIEIVNNLDVPQENKYPPQEIIFYKDEVAKSLTLPTENERKVLFILMCIVKRSGINYLYLNNGTPIKFSEICDLASVKLSCEKQDLLLGSLFKAKMIDVKIKPLLKCEILCLSIEGEIAFSVEWNNEMIKSYYTYVSPLRLTKTTLKKYNKSKITMF